MSSTYLTILTLCISLVINDCPLSYYPRDTVIGFLDAQLDNDPALHNVQNQYTYPLDEPFTQSDIKIAIAFLSISVNPNSQLKFYAKHVKAKSLQNIMFKIQVSDSNFGWSILSFNFLASQSQLFLMNGYETNQFSTGLQAGSYGVYQRLPLDSKYQQPVVKVFLNGLSLTGKQLNTPQYLKLINLFTNFRKTSSSKIYIQYFAQYIEEEKGLKFSLLSPKLIQGFLSFGIKTNCELFSLSYSYILFDNKVLSEMHNQVNDDFNILYGKSHQFTGLVNMGMVLSGLTSFTFPRDSDYNFKLSLQYPFERGVFETKTSHQYLNLGFSFVALEIKRKYVCMDCDNSPIIFQSFCVSQCPRNYNKVKNRQNYFCEKCSLDEFKVVDSQSGSCVCAQRYFKNSSNSCQECKYNCMSCNNTMNCLTCDNRMNQTMRILQNGNCICPQGFYDDQDRMDIVCQKCHPSCKSCYGPFAHDCSSCQADKKLDNFDHCVCKSGFSTNESGKCTCIPPLLVGGQCLTLNVNCSSNQQETSVGFGKLCVCKDGFMSILDKCIKCQANEKFDNDTLECICTNNTIRFKDRCVSCGKNQRYDEIENKCICTGNTFETQDSLQCISCPQKMTYENGKCQCIFNYFETNGVCFRCQSPRDGPKCRQIQLID